MLSIWRSLKFCHLVKYYGIPTDKASLPVLGYNAKHVLSKFGWLVVLGFNATLTAKVISWQS